VLLRALTVGVLAFAAAGCGGGDDGGTTEAGTTTTDLPPGCLVEDVQAIVDRFLKRGDLAPPGFFQVYGTNESDGRKLLTRNRAKAVAEIKRRQRFDERQRVISLQVAPEDINHVRMTFDLTRIADDFIKRGITTRIASGAGTIDCAHGKVAAWVVKGP
jgi:hypothetical protein